MIDCVRKWINLILDKLKRNRITPYVMVDLRPLCWYTFRWSVTKNADSFFINKKILWAPFIYFLTVVKFTLVGKKPGLAIQKKRIDIFFCQAGWCPIFVMKYYLSFLSHRHRFCIGYKKVTMEMKRILLFVCCSMFLLHWLLLTLFTLLCSKNDKAVSSRNTKHAFSFNVFFSSYD
jgi:hypothetical protein